MTAVRWDWALPFRVFEVRGDLSSDFANVSTSFNPHVFNPILSNTTKFGSRYRRLDVIVS